MPTDHPCVHMSLFPLVLVSTGHQGRDEMVGNLKKQVVSTVVWSHRVVWLHKGCGLARGVVGHTGAWPPHWCPAVTSL